MKEALQKIYKRNEASIHSVLKVLLYAFGILGTVEFLVEAVSFLTGSNDQAAFAGFDPRVDVFFLLPVVIHFYLLRKERLPLPFSFTSSFAFGLFLKHILISADPGFGMTRYVAFVIGGFVPLFFSYLLLPKIEQKQPEVVKQEIKEAAPIDFGRYPLRLDEEGRFLIPTEEQDMHAHIMGGTGSGKTVSGINSFVYQTIVDHRLGCLVYDVKSELGTFVAYAAKKAGRLDDLYFFSIKHVHLSQTMNPLAFGTANQIANRVYSALYFESDANARHYYELAAAVINALVTLLKLEYPVINFQMLYDCLNDLKDMKDLRALCQKYPHTNEAKYFENSWLTKTLKQRQDELSGLLNKLQRYCNRDWSPLINSLDPDISFKEAIDNNKIIYFDIDSGNNLDDAKPLSILMILNLYESLSDRYTNNPDKPFRVFLDEFYNIAYDKFVDIINKARSAKIDFFLSHQDFSDLSRVSREFATLVSSNAKTKIFFRIEDPDTAEYASKVFGTVMDEKKVFSYDTRDVLFSRPAGYTEPGGRKFRVLPDEIKEIPRGYAFIKIPFQAGPQYFMIEMFNSNKVGPPKKLNIETLIPTRNRQKQKVDSIKRVERLDLTAGRTPAKKNNLDKLRAAADDQLKKRPRPPAPQVDQEGAGDEA